MKKKYYHNNEYYEKNIYICQIDSVKFFNEDDYLEHYDEEHPDTYPFYCELCKRGFNHEKALISHINTSFKHKKKNKIPNLYCKICDKKFITKEDLVTHNIDNKHFQCKKCGKIFAYNIAINMHCNALNH